ncbi:hypothetical protein R1T43_04500 [Alteromonas sp. CI.11.F.A3]|uniref:hypothetical protein n=1 Tax=Alteromonas sp. CI.11.F.A3 TaxID=3079555 RepID=UPI0029423B92|nr:hypothetical protein [Alteromonas sp. CI.11.F.A3]WOI38301.1 hypothetical protein R1T43_04500 [Alteromonas sp. CI.11.F.A3]
MTLFKKMVSSVGLTLLLLTLLGCSHDSEKCDDKDAECMLSKVTASYTIKFLGTNDVSPSENFAFQSQDGKALGAMILDKKNEAEKIEEDCSLKEALNNKPQPYINVELDSPKLLEHFEADYISYDGNCYEILENDGNITALHIPVLDNPSHETESSNITGGLPHSMHMYIYRTKSENVMTYRVFHKGEQFSNNGAHNHDGDGSHSHDKGTFEVQNHNTTHGGGIGTATAN